MSNQFQQGELYRKIQVCLLQNKDRFYRILYLDKHLSVEELGVVLMTALHDEVSQDFRFVTGETVYTPVRMFDKDETMIRLALDRRFPKITKAELIPPRMKMEELGNSFFFLCGDRNRPWQFQCKLAKNMVTIESEKLALIEEGTGSGIIERYGDGTCWYLEGSLKSRKENEKIPEIQSYIDQLDEKRYQGFCDPLNIRSEQEYFDRNIMKNYCSFYDMGEPNPPEGHVFTLKEAHIIQASQATAVQQAHLISAVEEQIENVDFVRSTYRRLLKKYDEALAKTLIIDAMTAHLDDFYMQDRPYSQADYRKLLQMLK